MGITRFDNKRDGTDWHRPLSNHFRTLPRASAGKRGIEKLSAPLAFRPTNDSATESVGAV